MGDTDSTTIMPVEWGQFKHPERIMIPFSQHTGPTDYYLSEIAKLESFQGGYADEEELFINSREFIESLESRETNDIGLAWQAAIQSAFNYEYESDDFSNKMILHCLRLVTTSPKIFVGCFKLDKENRRAVFKVEPITWWGLHSQEPFPNDVARERHDIYQWIVLFEMFGKTFELDGWEPIHAESMLPVVDPTKQKAIRIFIGNKEVEVSLHAKTQMRSSIDYMATKPPLFFNSRQVMHAVCEILGTDLLSMSFYGLSKGSIDWDTVVPGEKDTYPPATNPSAEQFGTVKAIHKLVTEEKNEEARKSGLPHGGVPSYTIYLQRWKQWRSWHAVYFEMYPTYTPQMVLDKVCIQLKTCTSKQEIEKVIAQDIAAHRTSLKTKRRKQEIAQAAAAKKAEEAKAKEAAKKLADEMQAKETQISELENSAPSNFQVGQGKRTKATRRQHLLAKSSALNKAKKELAETKRKAEEAETNAQKATEETIKLSQQRKIQEQEEARLKALLERRKRSKRNETGRLNLIVTPRQKAATNAEWKPPMLEGRQYSEPGVLWVEESTKKIRLLSTLRSKLKDMELVGESLTFATAMSVAELHAENSTYGERVFLYVVCLMLQQTCTVDVVVGVLLELVNARVQSAQQMAEEMTADALATVIEGASGESSVRTTAATTVHDMAVALHGLNGILPQDKAGLNDIGIQDPVASLVMQHVFGSCELIVDLHGRKILTALDMLDWEETGAEEKTKTKMANIPAEKVKKSLRTWLPAGERAAFYDTMFALGNLLGAKTQGDWGKIKTTVSRNFSTKDKEKVMDMLESICQFYKVTKSGGRSFRRC